MRSSRAGGHPRRTLAKIGDEFDWSGEEAVNVCTGDPTEGEHRAAGQVFIGYGCNYDSEAARSGVQSGWHVQAVEAATNLNQPSKICSPLSSGFAPGSPTCTPDITCMATKASEPNPAGLPSVEDGDSLSQLRSVPSGDEALRDDDGVMMRGSSDGICAEGGSRDLDFPAAVNDSGRLYCDKSLAVCCVDRSTTDSEECEQGRTNNFEFQESHCHCDSDSEGNSPDSQRGDDFPMRFKWDIGAESGGDGIGSSNSCCTSTEKCFELEDHARGEGSCGDRNDNIGCCILSPHDVQPTLAARRQARQASNEAQPAAALDSDKLQPAACTQDTDRNLTSNNTQRAAAPVRLGAAELGLLVKDAVLEVRLAATTEELRAVRRILAAGAAAGLDRSHRTAT